MVWPDLRVQFNSMEQAAIDACSIIYLLKTGVLDRLAAILPLVTTEDVFKETLWPKLPVAVEPASVKARSHDHGLFLLAREKEIPLISDDKEVLTMAHEGGLFYYNSLMMLIYLEFKGRVLKEDYSLYYKRLMGEVHYSREIILQAQEYRNQLLQPIQ